MCARVYVVLPTASSCVGVCLAAFAQEGRVSVPLSLYFCLPSIFNNSTSLFPQPRLPHPDAGNFHPFFSFMVGSARKEAKVCSVDGWPDLLVSYSTDPRCEQPQSPAPGTLLCILESPHSSQDHHPLAHDGPPVSSEASPKCLHRTGGEENLTEMGPLFPTASLQSPSTQRKLGMGSLFTLELLRAQICQCWLCLGGASLTGEKMSRHSNHRGSSVPLLPPVSFSLDSTALQTH